jgi:hypothetical protein
MVATGIKECELDMNEDVKMKGKGERLVRIAKEMNDFALNKYWGITLKKRILLKIGINKGKVIAGVIGNPKP